MRQVTVAFFLLLSISTLGNSQVGKPTERLQAGASAIDISPKLYPLNMPGGFNANMAESAHDPLHARAIVLQSGKSQLAMVVVDSLGVSPEVLEEAKTIASRKTGLAKIRIMICSTHTHSAPPSNKKSGSEPATAYRKLLVSGIAESIISAHSNLEPASLGFATHPLPEEVFNRRWFLKPGKMPLNPFGKLDLVKMNPGRSPNVLDRPAGPTDPDLSVISIQNDRRKPLALWANYTLHYVGAIPKGQVSADYFGEFARLMPSRLRADKNFVAMMSNGASGDINNIPFNVTRPPREPFEQVKIVAGKAADSAWYATRKIKKAKSSVSLDMIEREIKLRHRIVSQEQLAEAQRILVIKDEDEITKLPRLAQAYARRTISISKLPPTVTVKLQVIRIGDIVLFCIPFETIVEIGLELKDRSPFPNTIVVGLANGRYGYLPTPRQHKLGGYETWLGTNKVQKDASTLIVRNLMEMAKKLHSNAGLRNSSND